MVEGEVTLKTCRVIVIVLPDDSVELCNAPAVRLAKGVPICQKHYLESKGDASK